MQTDRLSNRATPVNEAVIERPSTVTIVQSFPPKYRDIKLTTYNGPNLDVPKIEPAMRRLSLG